MIQQLLTSEENFRDLDTYFQNKRIKKIFLVCDTSIFFLKINTYFNELQDRLGIEVTRFSDFQPNPLYESVTKGVELFRLVRADMILAVGGGSAMDVAKCIKLYSNMDSGELYLKQRIVPNDIPFLAVPTTAGTGSEATRYAVVYYNGEKQSVSDYSCIPETVLMDPSVLYTLPEYQKKATMMDALCHAVESFWSVNSNEESRDYSREAIKVILTAKDGYLSNESEGCEQMLRAANLAGKAINITQTTAGHAMCYKLTSLYHIAHGHAAALCVKELLPYMISHTADCIDERGEGYIKEILYEISACLGCNNLEESPQRFTQLLEELGLDAPIISEDELIILKNSVNPIRLKNHPIMLSEKSIEAMYKNMSFYEGEKL